MNKQRDYAKEVFVLFWTTGFLFSLGYLSNTSLFQEFKQLTSLMQFLGYVNLYVLWPLILGVEVGK